MGVVRENMKFELYNDFYERRKYIKREFDRLSPAYREVYKYYVYSNRLLSDVKVDCIWEYLSEPSNSVYKSTEKKLEFYYNKSGDKH